MSVHTLFYFADENVTLLEGYKSQCLVLDVNIHALKLRILRNCASRNDEANLVKG